MEYLGQATHGLETNPLGKARGLIGVFHALDGSLGARCGLLACGMTRAKREALYMGKRNLVAWFGVRDERSNLNLKESCLFRNLPLFSVSFILLSFLEWCSEKRTVVCQPTLFSSTEYQGNGWEGHPVTISDLESIQSATCTRLNHTLRNTVILRTELPGCQINIDETQHYQSLSQPSSHTSCFTHGEQNPLTSFIRLRDRDVK